MIVATFSERLRQRALARKRGVLNVEDFLRQIETAGASPEVAKFVRNEAARYYFDPLTPDPNDRRQSTMRIDPEDLVDLTEKFWSEQNLIEPTHESPVRVPEDPSLLEYALWLEEQRAAHSS